MELKLYEVEVNGMKTRMLLDADRAKAMNGKLVTDGSKTADKRAKPPTK